LLWFLKPTGKKLSITAIAFYSLCNYILTLIYLHEIVATLNISRKARWLDLTPLRAGSGPWAGLWAPLV